MLKNISSIISPDLLWLLASMGHGDDLVLVDRNFPAIQVVKQTSTGRLIELPLEMLSMFVFGLARSCFEMSRRDGAIVAWHEVPGTAPPPKSRPEHFQKARRPDSLREA